MDGTAAAGDIFLNYSSEVKFITLRAIIDSSSAVRDYHAETHAVFI
ncbi:MAG: hypothetical protein PUK70_08435 [Bacteroidales bacterium]|nr:hypothetical protein [Bacteroidales bacterium]MDY6001074.1 hypothetical protein [Candidatus Cryptobacteroides sp.]